MKILDIETSELSLFQAAPEHEQLAASLGRSPEPYFKYQKGQFICKLSSLVLSRARPEGIKHAIEIMHLVQLTHHEKRDPILVKEYRDGQFLVIDGNSTTIAGLAAGWEEIICMLDIQPTQK